ncbi:hypothetical protein BKP64_13750 [Marinobacter salinus]|uniref:T6SS Phospholipase effector Tle1-like catalytic domain-containing protein n=1 Tax=Marinobacter salinus TaxID=1874317 RepID=A0A1D9GNM5_9GAMM|nr:DUF2235 domain-containing protein [Marinobacter salinus]AOY89144.1 hypothetical protein BKP64_13750 [Marinobacter salinus]
MVKRLVICADGTWNRPEEDLQKDVPTNVLRLARAIRPVALGDSPQHVFYDWGIGSYHNAVIGGVTGQGIHKNIMDAYRYIVQNYEPGSELYFFGFSRGAYTVRSLCGLINNCGILQRPDARLIQKAFDHYKKAGKDYAPSGAESLRFRAEHSHESREIRFVGAWDTVGALGVPFSLLGLFDRKDEFYDTKLGSNVRIARHALAIDERREDFEPTLWLPRKGLNLKQVWFAGSHSDIGGGYPADDNGLLASDIALEWMVSEAVAAGLDIEPHLPAAINPSPKARLHNSRRHIFRFSTPLVRPLKPKDTETSIHPSVDDRWRLDPDYRPPNLEAIGFQG